MRRKNKKDVRKKAKVKKNKKFSNKTTRKIPREKIRKETIEKGEIKKEESLSYFTQQELEEFKTLLSKRKKFVEEILKNRESDLKRSSLKEESGNLSSTPQHLAELGSQEYDKNFACIVLENAQKELKEIMNALEKIATGKYGICDNCNKPINKERLKVLPYTNLCLDCKILEENSLINP
ncbi:MAG: TraR/DksA family transcriptional regulator [Planctomycetota bacterium]